MQQLVKQPHSDIPDELLYGHVGYLYSQLFIIKNKLSSVYSDSDIKDVSFYYFVVMYFNASPTSFE